MDKPRGADTRSHAGASRRAAAAVKVLFAVGVFAGAAWVIAHEMRDARLDDILAAVERTPSWALAAAIAATLVSYAALAVSEWWALTLLGKRLKAWRILVVTFAAYAMSNGLGFSLATGGAARLRLYGAWGLRGADVASITVFAGAAVTLGGAVTAGLSLLVTDGLPAYFHALGVALLTPALLWLWPKWPALRFLPHVHAAPLGKRIAALTGAVADWLASGLALFVLLPEPTLHQFAPFLVVFILGSIVSAASGVPGGIGVFEAVILLLSRQFALSHESAAALILYRLIYAIGPLCITALGFAAWQALAAARKRA
jgi:phosphatidylglycerol lysyltransferase